MTLIARASTLASRVARGRRLLRRDALAINFSYVLHEASTSMTVAAAVRASVRHRRSHLPSGPTLLDGAPALDVDVWLAPTFNGRDPQTALTDANLRVNELVVIDQPAESSAEACFFRGPARLDLPSDEVQQVGIAGLIVRPYGRSMQLIVRGPFEWPSERRAAMRAMEALVQAHVEQWTPAAQLWAVPAEVAISDEVSSSR